MADITFLILTKNEEKNIGDCIESIKDFAKRIIVIDSGSDDDTCNVAKSMGAEVYVHPFENYARQFNWGLDNCNISTQWTFRLDADERLTPALIAELNKLIYLHQTDDVNGITMEATLFFLGRKIRHGGPQKRKLMLFKTGLGRIEDRKMDEHTVLLKGVSISCKEKFIHYDFKDITSWINKMNWYATREMQDYFEYINGKNAQIEARDHIIGETRKYKFEFYYRLPKFIRCWLLFVFTYVVQFGFLDGKEGFVYHWMYHRWYRTLVDSKILEQEITRAPFQATGDLQY